MENRFEHKAGGASGGTKAEILYLRRLVVLLRIIGLVFTLVAAILAGTNEETQTITFNLVDGVPPLHIPVTAKWNYMSATVYFVVVNAIASLYSTTSVILTLISRGRQNGISIILLVLDLTMVALLFSANGAETAVGIIALKGNSHAQWRKVCYIFKKFCGVSKASIVISMFGSFVFLWLVGLSSFTTHKNV